MLHSEEGKVSINVSSEEQLVTELATLLLEVKRQLRFVRGKEEGIKIYNAIINTAEKFN